MSKEIELAKQETQTQLQSIDTNALHALEIHTNDDQEFAAELLRDVKAKHTFIEGKRTAITKPLLEAKREVDALFKPVKEKLAECEQIIKAKIATYLREKTEQNAALLASVAISEDAEEAQAMLTTIEPVEKAKGISVRVVWDAEIINEGMLDRRFMSPDMTKIKQQMADFKNPDGSPMAIPGVKFTKREIVSSRSA